MATEVDSTATLSLMVFLGITLVYFILKYNFSQSGSMKLYTILYYLGVIVSQYFINLSVITERCGTTNWALAFMVTLIPWVIIFGILNVLLLQFPGWKAPFSNTIGYLIANIAGAKNLLIDYILKADYVSELSEKKKGGGKNSNLSITQKKKLTRKNLQKGGASEEELKLANEAIQHIYSDPSLLINEVTPQSYNSFWDRMKPLFKPDADEHKEDLYKLIELKEIVSEAIWYILTGSLITSISFNYIATADCGVSADEMKQRHDEYEQTMEVEASQPVQQKVYETTE